jgi:hypothetical protein
LNRYGRLAQRHWAATDPTAYQEIADPEMFFATLGEEAEQQIQDLQTMLAGPDQAGEEYLEKVGRLNMARLQAEEQILEELILIAPADSPTDDSPTDLVSDVLAAIHQADRENDPQG